MADTSKITMTYIRENSNDFIDRLIDGEEMMLTKNNKEIARITPIDHPRNKLQEFDVKILDFIGFTFTDVDAIVEEFGLKHHNVFYRLDKLQDRGFIIKKYDEFNKLFVRQP